MSARTTNLYGAIRTRILGFDPTGADVTLASALLTGGLHTLAPGDNAVFPYGALRLQNRRNGGRDDSSLSEEGQLELLLFGRPRGQLITIERVADIAEEALLNWHTDAVGWFTVREMENRTTMPYYPKPADNEIVQVRVVWRYTWWPTYRTQYGVAAGA